MRITSLAVHNVRRHADLSVSFAPGLTVVHGPNEAGKSTLQRAIEMALFRSATSTGQDLADLRRWGSAADDDPTIELRFEADGVPGRLAKSFARSAGTVRLDLGDQVLTDPRQVDQTVAELTGLPSEKFYRSTAGIRHAEMTALDGDGPELRDRLQQAISGADRGTAQARKSLEDVIRQYKSEGTKNPGVLRRTRDEVARLSAEVVSGERELDRLERDRASLAAARTRKLALDENLASDQAELTQVESALDLVRRADDAGQRYDRYRRAAEIRDELTRLAGAAPSAIPLAQLKDTVEQARQLEFDLSEGRAEIGHEPDPQTPPQPSVAESASSRTWLGAAGGLGIFGGLLFAAGLALGPAMIAFGLLLIVGACGLAVFGLRRQRREQDARAGNALVAAENQRRIDGRTARLDGLRRTERERDALLASIDAPDLATAEAALDAQSQHTARIEQLRAEERGLLGDAPRTEDVAALRDAAAADAEKARYALSGMGAEGRDLGAERTRLRASLDGARRQRDQALGEEGQSQGRVSSNPVDAEAVARSSEQLAGAEKRLQLAERRLRVYQTTLDAITSAEQQTMKKAARVLEETMGGDVATITDGRYRRIEVDESSLAFRVFSPERADWIPVSSLSHGTRDQLYLAARLGLVRQITDNHQPPLILDDPFVSFDDDRATRAIELLRTVGSDFQVILLTCSSRYNALADRVVELLGPALRDVKAEDVGVPDAPAADVGVPDAPAASVAQPEPKPAPEVIPEPPAPTRSIAPLNTGAQASLWDEPEHRS
jgi:DNA repair exonuclease SbcCD ATPase subunit